MSQIDKKKFFEKGESFCMYPWVHLHVNPTGRASPCCISQSCSKEGGVGDAAKLSLMELVNSEDMKQLRLDMLAGRKNKECETCYDHEASGVMSARYFANNDYGHYFDQVISQTNILDGSLDEFHMRYFDIRFSNICNFKCRTCGSGFSSQWEQEDLKFRAPYAKVLPKNNNKEFFQNVVDQIDYMEMAYFAGGEPLITEEHYILLEEMIRRGRTDIKLRYNTNLSNLKFKSKDLLGLWSNFEHPIEVYASIDHVGAKAEYIRNGTDWETVEENFMKVKNTPNVVTQINSVLSIFNYLTIDEFYKYLIDTKMYTVHDRCYTLYCASTPYHIASHALPEDLKQKGKEAINRAVEYMKKHNFQDYKIKQLTDTHSWVDTKHTYWEERENISNELRRLDAIRGENFAQTFPELKQLLLLDKRKMWPV
jgi:MoaA/NifB/PqqE/SkfB family radical SAM enzyme